MITIFSYVSMTIVSKTIVSMTIIMPFVAIFLAAILERIDPDKYLVDDLELKDPYNEFVKWTNGRFTGICKIVERTGFIWYCCLVYSIIWVPVVLLIEEYSHITIPVMPIILILIGGIVFYIFCCIIFNEIKYVLFLWKSGPVGRIGALSLVILTFVIVNNLI